MKAEREKKRKRTTVAELENRVRALENLVQDLGESTQETAEAAAAPPQLMAALLSRGLRRKVLERVREIVDEPLFDYFLFEYGHRGSREDIAARQQVYLPLFKGHEPVLDIGCGRGEFLGLLASQFIDAYGIDLDRDNVLYCEEMGLTVEQADAFQHLAQLQPGSLGGIYLGQVIEHMPPRDIQRLAALGFRALRPGGIFAADTVNPQCLSTLGWFYKDPTHVNPVPRDLCVFILDQVGFVEIRTIDLSPVPDYGRLKNIPPQSGDTPNLCALTQALQHNIDILNNLLFGYQEYGVVAIVPSDAPESSREL